MFKDNIFLHWKLWNGCVNEELSRRQNESSSTQILTRKENQLQINSGTYYHAERCRLDLMMKPHIER